jgi:flavin reductase (DIM6/NTAB) family NADH-FMN oxidoreductase RutF
MTAVDDAGQPTGMTANAVCAVSQEPPLLLACLNRSSLTGALIRRRTRFGINTLRDGQQSVAEFCARRGGEKRLHSPLVDLPPERAAPPAITGALAYFHCVVDVTFEAGTHVIFLAWVEGILLGQPGEPLTYFQGTYRHLGLSPEHAVDSLWDLLARHGS